MLRETKEIARGTYNFDTDLQNSYIIEREFGSMLEKRKDIHSVTYNDNYKYDVKVEMDNRTMTFEIKNDMMSAKTGNIGVEFECRGKPSGINRSEAEFWVFKLKDGYWTINANKLKRLIDEEHYTRIAVGGDVGSNTKMYLFRADFLKGEMKKYG
jgi:hypothetical protein